MGIINFIIPKKNLTKKQIMTTTAVRFHHPSSSSVLVSCYALTLYTYTTFFSHISIFSFLFLFNCKPEITASLFFFGNTPPHGRILASYILPSYSSNAYVIRFFRFLWCVVVVCWRALNHFCRLLRVYYPRVLLSF